MRKVSAFVAVGLVTMITTPQIASAGSIVDVATVALRLESAHDAATCTSSTPDDCLAVFTLDYLWPFDSEYSALAPDTLFGDFTATIRGETYLTEFLAVPNDVTGDVVYSDTFSPFVLGAPSSASASIAFLFLGTPHAETQSFDLQNLFMSELPNPDGLLLTYRFELDDVAVVPEPSTLSLLALGLVAHRGLRRFKRSRA